MILEELQGDGIAMKILVEKIKTSSSVNQEERKQVPQAISTSDKYLERCNSIGDVGQKNAMILLLNMGHENFEINLASLKIANNLTNMDDIINQILDNN